MANISNRSYTFLNYAGKLYGNLELVPHPTTPGQNVFNLSLQSHTSASHLKEIRCVCVCVFPTPLPGPQNYLSYSGKIVGKFPNVQLKPEAHTP